MWKHLVVSDRLQMTVQYDAWDFRAIYIRLQTHTQNTQYLFLFHSNNSYTKALRCYVCTLSCSLSLCFDSFYDFSSSFFVFHFTHLVSYSVFLPFSYTIPLLSLFPLVLIPLSISFFPGLSLTFGLIFFRAKLFDISSQKSDSFHL